MSWRPDGWLNPYSGVTRQRYPGAEPIYTKLPQEIQQRAYEDGANAILVALKAAGHYIEDETATNRDGLGHTTPGWRVWIPEDKA